MKRQVMLSVAAMTLVAGCSLPLTPGGRELIVYKNQADMPQGCSRRLSYTGQSKFGSTKTLNYLRNKVAAENGGNTLLISGVDRGFASPARRIYVIAFDCTPI